MTAIEKKISDFAGEKLPAHEIVEKLGVGWSIARLLTNHRNLLGYPPELPDEQLANLIAYYTEWGDKGVPPRIDPLTAKPLDAAVLADGVEALSGPGETKPLELGKPKASKRRLLDRLKGEDKKLGMPANVSVFSRPGTTDSFLKAVYCPPELAYAFAYNPAVHKDIGYQQVQEFKRQGYRPLQMDEVTQDEDKARDEGILCFQTFEPGPEGTVAIGGQLILVTTKENEDFIREQISRRAVSDLYGGMNKALSEADVPRVIREQVEDEFGQDMEKRRAVLGLNTDNPMDDPRLSSNRR